MSDAALGRLGVEADSRRVVLSRPSSLSSNETPGTPS